MIRLAVRAPADAAELVLAELLDLAPSGVEQVDGDGVVELAVYGAPGELPALDPGDAVVGGVRVTVSATEVPDDWEERWKRFHVPVLVGGSVYLRPPWEEAVERPGVVDIEIDPGQAFGTGAHPTTRLSLELLLDVLGEVVGGPVCDLGCGSGVLAIAAARLGLGPVRALDFDPAAVEATAANAERNRVTLASVECFDLRTAPAPPAELMLANLMRPLLLRVAELIRGPPRLLILSGLLEPEADEIAAAFSPLRERRRLTDRGWSALLLGRVV
ncbi:MAG: 50S ribosomal protein L11 methyltransferase [Thermoleophilaceae bacterium]